ncbi:MAG TPA: HlyD family type I secretion periplasmic adaptor subunit [Stellaceae bacterium]
MTITRTQRSIRLHLAAGVGVAILLVGGVGGWAATSELAGAVIAQGQLVVDTNVKKVQHPAVGIVKELHVRTGDHVKAGDLLIKLDDTQIRANLDMVVHSLDELSARRAREEAERDGADTVTFPPDLLARQSDPMVALVIEGEGNLFGIRRSARAGQKAQLRAQIAEIEEQVKGQSEQLAAQEKQTEWIVQELKGTRDLWQKNLVQFGRLTSLEREAARLKGEHGALLAQIAQNRGKIAETELRILQIDEDVRTEVGKDLSENRAKTSELTEKRIAADDQLRRVEIRAPHSGLVHELAVHTVGGVIKEGDTIMLIVPEGEKLLVEAKVQPQDIDQLYIGQPASLRFSAFNQRTTPELNGTVSLVSADVVQDTRVGQNAPPYYIVRVSIAPEEIARLGDVKLVPGMPVEVFARTHERTALSYLIRPVHDQVARAFKEK